jgi:tetratricopeptide (TPR) repeat protein
VIGYALWWVGGTLLLYAVIVRLKLTARVRWTIRRLRQPWNPVLLAMGYNDLAVAFKAGGETAVAEAWNLDARIRPYAARPQRRYRVATAVADGLIGSTLVRAAQWDDALAHLLPAISGLRGIRPLTPNLTLYLEDAVTALEAQEDTESRLPLVDEALTLLRRKGPQRWQGSLYYHALQQRMSCLRELGRMDEVDRMWPEIRSAAAGGAGDEGALGPLFTEYAHCLTTANRPAEAIEPATIGLERAYRLSDPAYVHRATQALAYALLQSGQYEEAAHRCRAAVELSQDLPANVLDRMCYGKALVRLGRTEEAAEVLGAEPEDTDGFFARQNRALYAMTNAEILEQRGRRVEAGATARLAEERFGVLVKMRPESMFETELADLRALRDRLTDPIRAETE